MSEIWVLQHKDCDDVYLGTYGECGCIKYNVNFNNALKFDSEIDCINFLKTLDIIEYIPKNI